MENTSASIDNTTSTNSSPRNNSPLRLNPPEYQNSSLQNNSPYRYYASLSSRTNTNSPQRNNSSSRNISSPRSNPSPRNNSQFRIPIVWNCCTKKDLNETLEYNGKISNLNGYNYFCIGKTSNYNKKMINLFLDIVYNGDENGLKNYIVYSDNNNTYLAILHDMSYYPTFKKNHEQKHKFNLMDIKQLNDKKRYFENNKKTLEEGEILINEANENPLTMDGFVPTKKQRFEISSETQNLKTDSSIKERLSIDTFINETLSEINSLKSPPTSSTSVKSNTSSSSSSKPVSITPSNTSSSSSNSSKREYSSSSENSSNREYYSSSSNLSNREREYSSSRPSSTRSSSSIIDSSKREYSTTPIVNNSKNLLNEPRFDVNFRKDGIETSKNLKIAYCIDGKLKFSENSGDEIGFLKNSQIVIPINSKIRKIVIFKND